MKSLYKSILLPFFLLIFSSLVNAQDYVYLGGWSSHFSDHPNSHREFNCTIDGCVFEQKKDKWNENHQMIGYQTNGYLIAHFENSFGQGTWVIDKNFTIANPGNFEFLAALGISYGYTDCHFKNGGTKTEFCPHYSFGVAYNKFRIEPVISTGGDYISLAFRIKL